MHALWCFKRLFLEIQGIVRTNRMSYLESLEVFEIIDCFLKFIFDIIVSKRPKNSKKI